MSPSTSSARSLRPRAVAAHAGRVVRAAAFWSAVVLPVAVMITLGLGVDLSLVGALLLCDAAALVAGHGHRVGDDATPAGQRNRDH